MKPSRNKGLWRGVIVLAYALWMMGVAISYMLSWSSPELWHFLPLVFPAAYLLHWIGRLFLCMRVENMSVAEALEKGKLKTCPVTASSGEKLYGFDSIENEQLEAVKQAFGYMSVYHVAENIFAAEKNDIKRIVRKFGLPHDVVRDMHTILAANKVIRVSAYEIR